MRTLLALEPTDDEVRRVRELDDARRSRRRRLTGIGLAVVVVAGAVSAAPPTRAALDDWRQFFGPHAVILLGPASIAPNQPFDERGRRPLFGLAAKSVARVELTYTSGPPTSDDDVDGGFGFLADATRAPQALVAYDRNGRQIERRDMSTIDLRECFDVRGCPPGRLQPRRR